MLIYLICLLIFLSFASVNDAARILAVFPTASISHQVVFRPLTQELAKRGHEVVVITTDPAFPKGRTPANLTEIDVHDISYDMWKKQVGVMSTGHKDDLQTQIYIILDMITKLFDEQLQSPAVKDLIEDKRQNFDLLMLEACVRPALVLSHRYKVPVIQVSSLGSTLGNYEAMGAPVHPLLYPTAVRQRLYNLTIWEKLYELYNHYNIERMYMNQEEINNAYAKKQFGPDTPALSELSENIHMLFLNTLVIWEGNRPVPPGVIHMGGIHQNPERKLPEDLKAYLDSSKNGVIYLSYGTNVNPSLLPPEKIQMLINVFSRLPYDVLWKWNKDVLPGQSKNIKISKWLPQSDLLRHPKIKLFITQGGLQSTDETISAGVPVIGMPMLADQWYNVEKYVHHGIGLRLDMETLTEEQFENGINTVIGDDSYRRNIVKLRELMRDQPQRPLERAVWWTEHVLRHGGATHLRAPAANISWREYLELDLVIIITIILVAILFLFFIFIYYVLKLIANKSVIIKSKKN